MNGANAWEQGLEPRVDDIEHGPSKFKAKDGIPTVVDATPQGTKHDTGKTRFELVPVDALEGLAKVLTFGAKKYADRNWEKGIKYSRVYGALARHILAWWGGEDTDPETGLSHLDHAACCIFFLSAFTKREMANDIDDRP